MVKARSCPALMHTSPLVAPAAKPFAVVAAHVWPWVANVDDSYLVSARMTHAAQGQRVSKAKPESSYSPRMRDPPPALDAPPPVEYETPPFFALADKGSSWSLLLAPQRRIGILI